MGQPFAVLPKSSPDSSKHKPQVLFDVLRRNSSFVTLSSFAFAPLLQLEAVEALAEVQPLAVHGTAEARVANRAVYPVVEAVVQVARPPRACRRCSTRASVPGARRPCRPPVVSLRNSVDRRLMHDQAARVWQHARRDAELVREHRHLVAHAVAVGVFAE